MDPSGSDFTMHHPNHTHHHPHYHHQNGGSPSNPASRCPALRAAAEQRSYHPPTISPTRSSVPYDPVHARPGNRDIWQSRSPQNWRPAMISPFAQDPLVGAFPGPTPASQPAQPQQPPCPMPTVPPQIPSFHQQFRPTMHPAPRLLGQPPYQNSGGFSSSNPNQSNARHAPNRPMHGANSGLPASPSTHPVPSVQGSAPRPAAAPTQMVQATSFNNENISPSQQLPNLLPHIFNQEDQATPEPIPQTSSPLEENISRPSSHSPSASVSTASQRTNDQLNRIVSPVEIRRASTAAMGRARRAMPRFTATPSDWLGENAVLFRRGDMSLMEFVENFPGAISDGEAPFNSRFLRGATSGKRVASKKALASLQSVAVGDLPENERTCVICYNDFGVANPEGINEAPLRLPKCKHVFGDHCIKKWFQESDSCPYCRDKVHSELQPMPPRRGHPGFRFITPNQITAQHLPGYQGQGQSQPRDRDISESESSYERFMAGNTADRPSSQLLDTSMNNRSPSGGRRPEGTHPHGMRIPSWNATYERRSPPTEHDRRRRPRHRARVSPPSTRPSIFGGSTSNGASQTSYHWNGSPPPDSNQTGGPMTPGQPIGLPYDASGMPFHQPFMVDDLFDGLASRNPGVIPTNEHPSGLPQMPSDPVRYLSTPSDMYLPDSGHASSNQFTSYQQS